MPCNDDGALELHLSDPEISEPEDSADASAGIISFHVGGSLGPRRCSKLKWSSRTLFAMTVCPTKQPLKLLNSWRWRCLHLDFSRNSMCLSPSSLSLDFCRPGLSQLMLSTSVKVCLIFFVGLTIYFVGLNKTADSDIPVKWLRGQFTAVSSIKERTYLGAGGIVLRGQKAAVP